MQSKLLRLAALLIDYALAVVLVASVSAGGMLLSDAKHDQRVTAAVVTVVIALLLVLTWGRDSWGSRSVGRRLFGLRVVNVETGQAAGALRCLVRNLCLLGGLCGVELLVLLSRPDGRRLGDLLAGTRVESLATDADIRRRLGFRAGAVVAVVIVALPVWVLLFGLPMPATATDRSSAVTYESLSALEPSVRGLDLRERFRRTEYVDGSTAVEYVYGSPSSKLYVRTSTRWSSDAEQLFRDWSDTNDIRDACGDDLKVVKVEAPYWLADERALFRLRVDGVNGGHAIVLRSNERVTRILLRGVDLSDDQLDDLVRPTTFFRSAH